MILIAGDLFDSGYVSPETRELCLSLFEGFGGYVVIAPGNHDPRSAGSFYATERLPENVRVFEGSELEQIDFPDLKTTVAGYAFTSAALPQSPLAVSGPAPHEELYVLCAHAELDTPTSRYAPVTTAEIERYAFDYAALGHVHNPHVGTERIRYCGFPEGRSFDELGDGTVLIVDLAIDREPAVSVHDVSDERYLWQEISLDGVASLEEACGIIGDAVEGVGGKPTNLRIDVTGTVCPDVLPDLSVLAAELGEKVVTLELRDHTLCLPDKAYLEKDTTLRGEFYRSLLPELMSDDVDERLRALRALKIGLAAIDGKDFTDGGSR